MKANIFNKKSVMMIVAMFIASVAYAQTDKSVEAAANEASKAEIAANEAHKLDQKRKVAIAANDVQGTANDVKWGRPTVEKGLVTELPVIRHYAWAVSVAAGGTVMFGDAPDLGSETAKCATFDLTLEYMYYHCKKNGEGKNKNPFAGLYLAGTVEQNTTMTIENERTSATAFYVAFGTILNPCGKLKAVIAATGGYRNSTSQRYISNDVAEGFVDYKGNPWYWGGTVKISYPILYRTRKKLVTVEGQNIKVKAKTAVELFAKGRLGFAEIGKPKVNNETLTWNGTCASFFIGATIGL